MKTLEIAEIVFNLIKLVRAANHPHVTHDQVGSLISDGLRVIDHLKQQQEIPEV